MTGNTQVPLDSRDASHDAEIYRALWAAAPFPRLPADAPNEVKTLIIELDDPRRVYVIHRASRRHHFQILVERYIHQMRYGCQSKTCTAPTCFSCRRRLAGNVPVRRYNATSARTLAVYMASQDNPEQGICHSPSAYRLTLPSQAAQKPVVVKHTLKSGLQSHDSTSGTQIKGSDRSGENGSIRRKRVTSARSLREMWQEDSDDSPTNAAASPQHEQLKAKCKAAIEHLDEPTTTDHRSFVQNVFGTVAFKMVEWLTPRNLDRLARVVDSNSVVKDELVSTTGTKPEFFDGVNEIARPESDSRRASPGTAATQATRKDVYGGQTDTSKPVRRPRSSNLREPINIQDIVNGSAEPHLSNLPKTPLSSSPGIRRRADSIESPKSILNIPTSPKLREQAPDLVSIATNFCTNKPTRKLTHQATIISSQLNEAEISPDLIGMDYAAVSTFSTLESEEPQVEPAKPDFEETNSSPHATSHNSSTSQDDSINSLPLPQSLSHLTIETINFLCDALQADGTCEKHVLQPQRICDSLKKRRDNTAVLKRRQGSTSQVSTRDQWRSFIEQSFFDVLSKTDSALQTFRDSEGNLFDTQTMWYLMLRMTRVAPSLVFDSLWNMAGALFRPPENLEVIYERGKDQRALRCPTARGVSCGDAAQIINICLHALVAAVPLVIDARLIANISRIRSRGLTLLGKNSSALESPTLCLQYDDIFSDELALRLARRVFAAIPTRRRFAELLNHQREFRSDSNLEPDVLQNLMDTMKFLDLGTLPVLNFPDDERNVHEKRIPTLVLDWARTVMLHDWQGTAEVAGDGPFGGALAVMAAIYKNRKTLLLGDTHFRTEYFADRLDPVAMPLEWMSFEANKMAVHLLDHTFLFKPSTLVTYFRAINFSRMHQAHQTALITDSLVNTTATANSLLRNDGQLQRLYARLRVATALFLMLDIGRKEVLVDTFNAIWRREERELLRPLKIRLGEESGEEGSDSGGVQQEFFRLAVAEALDPAYGAFTIDSKTNMTWFQPGSPEPLWKFELIGMIFSLAVYNGLTLPVTFPQALYRKLLDKDVTELHHIADGWPQLADGLTRLLEWDEKDGLVEEVFARTYEFSVEQFGQPVSREMGAATHWPQFSDLQYSTNPTDAPMVTNENRNSYVSDYIRWLTDISIWPQFQAFKSGFHACLDRRSLTLLDPETLQSVVEGIQEIEISELRRTVRYVGWDASHRSIRDFWSIVKRYDLEQRRKLLEFVTASDRVPVGGMRNVQFTIQRNGTDDGHLPSSYTCYGIFLLPEYSSKEVLRERLATALENSRGFGFA